MTDGRADQGYAILMKSIPWPRPTDPAERPRRWRETTDGLYVDTGGGEWWRTDGIDLVPESAVDAHTEATGCGIVVKVEDVRGGAVPASEILH
jgi:hypothetical protein